MVIQLISCRSPLLPIKIVLVPNLGWADLGVQIHFLNDHQTSASSCATMASPATHAAAEVLSNNAEKMWQLPNKTTSVIWTSATIRQTLLNKYIRQWRPRQLGYTLATFFSIRQRKLPGWPFSVYLKHPFMCFCTVYIWLEHILKNLTASILYSTCVKVLSYDFS